MKKFLTLLTLSLILIGAIIIMPVGNSSALSVGDHNIIASAASNEACSGVGLFDGSTCGDQGAAVNSALSTIINIFSAVVGVIAVIMIIVSGLQFITSSGNPQSVSKARSSLIYAIIGIVIVILAQLIVHFVINQVNAAH
jgi:cytochrome bd-type quinol oxidase subunit 2